MLAEGDQRDAVAGGLRGHEGGCRCRGLNEWLSCHRAGGVEREHDVLTAAEIDGLQSDDPLSVLEQARLRRRKRGGDHRRADLWIRAEVHTVEPDAGTCRARRRGERSHAGYQSEPENGSLSAHLKLPYGAFEVPTYAASSSFK